MGRARGGLGSVKAASTLIVSALLSTWLYSLFCLSPEGMAEPWKKKGKACLAASSSCANALAFLHLLFLFLILLILLFFKQESDTQFLLKIMLEYWLLCAVFFARRDSAEQTSVAR